MADVMRPTRASWDFTLSDEVSLSNTEAKVGAAMADDPKRYKICD